MRAGPQRPSGEPWATTWGRRSLTVPLFFGLALACLVLSPVWLPLMLLTDAVRSPWGRWPRTRTLIFLALYVGCEVLGVLAAGLVWLVLGGGRWVSHERYEQAHRWLQRIWSGVLFHGARVLLAWRLVLEGLELARGGPLLVLLRHSSTADTVLAAALVANPQRLNLRYVLKRELLWDPCLDIVGRRLPNAFVDRQSARPDEEVESLAQLAQRLDPQSGVVIYPEGTRFAPSKRDRAIQALRDKGPPELADMASTLRHVLPPRPGGTLALLETAPEADVLLIEHTGLEGAASLGDLWRGALVRTTLHVRLRRFPAASIPKEERARWLYARWQELDGWIAEKHAPMEGLK